jgi:hypothetical protein
LIWDDFERWREGKQLKLERGDSSDDEARNINVEQDFLKSIYPRVDESLIHKLL